MKITITDQCSRNTSYPTGYYWTQIGGCHFPCACHICFFYAYTEHEHCSALRDRFILHLKPTTLPYIFDTDDYPELLL